MPYRILIADDDDAIRNSHKFALEVTADIVKAELMVVESSDSVDTMTKIRDEQFDLILLDNDFKDGHIRGHLPGIAILQLARKEGKNLTTPIVFCSAETFEALKPMVERFGCIHLPKTGMDMDEAAKMFADQLQLKKK